MSVKPILFNAEMLRAILDGRKTVTRRLVNPQPLWIEQDKKYRTCPSGWWWGLDRIKAIEDSQLFAQMLAAECAPYRVGDILYVRETWAYGCTFATERKLFYRADGDSDDVYRWRPSIHMPREAARIFLRVTDVRVERLQKIDEDGAIAEGCSAGRFETTGGPWGVEDNPDEWTAREDFSHVWDGTVRNTDRARYGWAANPWVWVIAFERCAKPKEAIDGSV